MARRLTSQALVCGPFLWGPRRGDLRISLRALEKATGIYRGDLSKMERGRLFPTAAEYDAVVAALVKGETR